MAKRVFSVASFTPTATADGVATAGTYAAMVPGGTDTLALLQIMEITQTGQASASAFNAMTVSRSSTLGATPTTLALPNSDGFMRAGSAALTATPVCYVAATTAPTRAAAYTVARMNIGFNSFGGIFRWVAAPGEEWTALGYNVVSQSETLFNSANFGTAGAQGLSVVYELL